jgi:hypothetical protein
VKFADPVEITERAEVAKPVPSAADYAQTTFAFAPEDSTEQSIFSVAIDGLDRMLMQYIMFLTMSARESLVEIIRVKDPSRASYVDIGFDPRMPFDVTVVEDDGTSTLIHKEAHELLYGSLCESGDWKGHWMKYRKNYFHALTNFNNIQRKVFDETGFYLSDVSTEKNVVSLVLANRFGQFQLIKQQKGRRFWHKHVYLPASVFSTLSKRRDSFLDDAPEFIYVPDDGSYESDVASRVASRNPDAGYDSSDLEDEDNFVHQMIRTTRC